MDVHDLAREIMRTICPDDDALGFSSEAPWSAIAETVLLAEALWPLIESHTRAAVEAERAACEAVAVKYHAMFDDLGDRSISVEYANGHEDGQQVAADDIANAIAARKAQP